MRPTLSLSILAAVDVVCSAAVKRAPVPEVDYLYFGVILKNGATSKVTATMGLGNAYRQPSYTTVLDTASPYFWTWQDNAVLHWGSETPGAQGSCNMTIHKLYQYTPSNSPTSEVTAKNTTFISVGNTELVSGVSVVNDSVSFIWGQEYININNVEFALENYGRVQKSDDGSCAAIPYDEITIGLSPSTNSTTAGPSFRQSLFNKGTILSKTMTMWFDQYTGALGSLSGGIAFGGIDTSKFTGPLVRVPNAATENEIGLYVNKPKLSIGGKNIKLGDNNNTNTTTTTACSINSGAPTDTLPLSTASKSAFLSAAGLVEYNGVAAYPGACDSIPPSSTLTYKFAGSNCNETVAIDIPLRNYARGLTSTQPDAAGLCLLNLKLVVGGGGEGGCVLGAPFLTGAFLALDDDVVDGAGRGAIALAQGGVAVKGSGLDAATFRVLGSGESF